jgi:5-methylcytosine-specific restriction endonuclease McrA
MDGELMEELIPFIAILGAFLIRKLWFEIRRRRRRDYYRNSYLQSDTWQRKRFVVLRRDNWQCVYCGARDTQVHHKKYAKRTIGKEPTNWLVSVCPKCHDKLHA